MLHTYHCLGNAVFAKMNPRFFYIIWLQQPFGLLSHLFSSQIPKEVTAVPYGFLAHKNIPIDRYTYRHRLFLRLKKIFRIHFVLFKLFYLLYKILNI